jgi:hypothetical protein
MRGDRLLNSPSHTGENSTYSLQFRAPQFQCNTSTFTEEIGSADDDYPAYRGYHSPEFESIWTSNISTLLVTKHVMNHIYPNPENRSRLVGVFDAQRLECRGVSRLFDLRISHHNNVQKIECNITEAKPLFLSSNMMSMQVTMPPIPWTNTSDYGEKVRNITKQVASLLPTMNEMALLDALGTVVESKSNQRCYGGTSSSDVEWKCTSSAFASSAGDGKPTISSRL